MLAIIEMRVGEWFMRRDSTSMNSTTRKGKYTSKKGKYKKG